MMENIGHPIVLTDRQTVTYSGNHKTETDHHEEHVMTALNIATPTTLGDQIWDVVQ